MLVATLGIRQTLTGNPAVAMFNTAHRPIASES